MDLADKWEKWNLLLVLFTTLYSLSGSPSYLALPLDIRKRTI